jgi:2-desacetyl-2-hydroxyethyl bacteriochlorophyllide A dehydrogenase
MTGTVRAAVHLGGRNELRSFPRPRIPVDGGLLRIEAAGVCGSDVGNFAKAANVGVIMGHENVGHIEEIGPVAADRWGAGVGDRVLLEEYLPCWHCAWCHQGEFRHCIQTDHRENPDATRFGRTPVDIAPALFGGYGEYLYMPARSVVHRIAAHVPQQHAAMALPLANGFQWGVYEPNLGAGDSVIVIGPGQQGLGCVLAATTVGAGLIIVAGRSRDARRLEVAKALGAHHVVDVDTEDLEERVREITGGAGVDAVVDTASGTAGKIELAVALLKRKAGTAVLQGVGRSVTDFSLTKMASKYVTLKIARGHSTRAVRQAVRLIESGAARLDLMSTHTFGLSEVDDALRAGLSDPDAIHVTVDPWR